MTYLNWNYTMQDYLNGLIIRGVKTEQVLLELC